jgi:integrase/recombinase XerD
MTPDTTNQIPARIAPANRLLIQAEFHRLADVPPEVEWFANLSNAGIVRPEEFRAVTRAHIIAWRDELVRRELGGGTIRLRLALLASLFEYLCGPDHLVARISAKFSNIS